MHSLKEEKFLGFDISDLIIGIASKYHGALDIYNATPLRACKNGGQKVIILSEFKLAKRRCTYI